TCLRLVGRSILVVFVVCTAPAPAEIFPLSLHDALPICTSLSVKIFDAGPSIKSLPLFSMRIRSNVSAAKSMSCKMHRTSLPSSRSEEHTSELQSRFELVCRLLLEKKNIHDRVATQRVMK